MSSSFERIFWIVLDSLGIGALPDAAAYGDSDSDTLGHIASHYQLNLPYLRQLGLANIRPIPGIDEVAQPSGAFGKCALASPGKDTTTGHWEMAGIILLKPFPLFPNGFPSEFITAFEAAIGRRIIGNKAASGTEILKELGDEHCRTGFPIVYTSADSVFQIAAHEQIVSPPELFAMCKQARRLLAGPLEIGRVIARPFTGSSGVYRRSASRQDFAVPPPAGMLLDCLSAANVKVTSIGKIADIFDGRGISCSFKTKDNRNGMECANRILQEQSDGLIWLNLVDFDQVYGHRNDVVGYAQALEAVDAWLPSLPTRPDDLVIVTADHGCDPTTPTTDHSREYVPLIVYGDHVQSGVSLGTRRSLADIGQTVAQNFGSSITSGQSFLGDIRKG